VAKLEAIAGDDWERARAVYVWVTEHIAYDTAAYFSGRYGALDAESVFRSGSSVCSGYSDLFARLSTDLGLEARTISGYSKGAGYRPGQSFRSTNHAWNAIYIDGGWHLFDSTWGAGNVNGRAFEREYDEFWFDTHPDLFLRTHLPANSEWQLAEFPTTLAQYEAEPHMFPYQYAALFSMGFRDEEVLASLRSDSGFPMAYSNKGHPVTVEDAPLAEALAAGGRLRLRVHAPGQYEAAFINNSEWTFFERQGDYLVGQVTPTRGSLKVSVRLNPGKRSYSTLLQYRVE
jgi:hypothetical protein